MNHYILKDGEPVATDLITWGKWLQENSKEKLIKQEYVKTGVFPWRRKFWISTVFLGLDHSWIPGGPPIIFETMVFKYNMWGEITQWFSFLDYLRHRYITVREKRLRLYTSFSNYRRIWRYHDVWQNRYSTLLQAQEGHEATVRDVRLGNIR